MVRTLLKLALVALVANATWHVFSVYSTHYKFQDGVQYATQYAGDASNEMLRDRILELAERFEIPITADDVSVSRNEQKHTIVNVSYVRRVELAPGLTYPWTLSVHVDAFSVKPPTAEQLIPK